MLAVLEIFIHENALENKYVLIGLSDKQGII